MREEGGENGKENSRELKNNDDIPQFLSPPPLLFLSLCCRDSEAQCQRDFTAKISLCYRMRYRLDTCDRAVHKHTHTHTQHRAPNQSDKNKRPRKLKPEMGGEAGEQEEGGIMK